MLKIMQIRPYNKPLLRRGYPHRFKSTGDFGKKYMVIFFRAFPCPVWEKITDSYNECEFSLQNTIETVNTITVDVRLRLRYRDFEQQESE